MIIAEITVVFGVQCNGDIRVCSFGMPGRITGINANGEFRFDVRDGRIGVRFDPEMIISECESNLESQIEIVCGQSRRARSWYTN